MNKRQIIASLNNIAHDLDNAGLYLEATSLTNVMKRLAEEELGRFSLKRSLERFERFVEDEFDNNKSIQSRIKNIRDETVSYLNDTKREDRAEFQKAADAIVERFNKTHKNRTEYRS